MGYINPKTFLIQELSTCGFPPRDEFRHFSIGFCPKWWERELELLCSIFFCGTEYQNDFDLEMSNVTYQLKYFVASEADEKASLVSSQATTAGII